jgi:hypothetical protein
MRHRVRHQPDPGSGRTDDYLSRWYQIWNIWFGCGYEDLYRQGKPATNEVASEIMERLEGYNYFATSVRHIYKFLLLEEYRRFLEFKSK